jgi:hypothetical protein
MSVSPFIGIDDGYTMDGKIKAVPGLVPEMTFKFRPVSWSERTHFFGLGGEYEKQGKFVDELITAKIVSWSFPEPATLDMVKRIKTALKVKILDIILEYAASDEAGDDAKN